jgi:CheY-like chemotaxis protein
LGLSTIHAIIAQHGGFITVQSTPGLGTEFTIRLPLVSSTVTTEPGSDIPHPLSQLRGHGSLLVVEDNALVRDLTVRALEMQGYRVHSASNAKECLAKIEDWSEQFDLLLTDLVMPDMNGKALFEVLNARFEHLRVIYMSGYSRAFITQQHGIDEDVPFLQKPFSIQKLLSTLRQLLATES